MRTRIVILVITLAAGIASLASASPVESFTVNGLKVIFAPSTTTDIIAVNMYFRGGATVLDPRLAGIESFALSVATEASKNYPKERLHAALDRMDSRIGSAAMTDFSSVTLQCVKRNFAESWKIFADVLLNPAFEPSDVELLRGRVLSAIKQTKDNPDQYLQELAGREFYAGHPYETSITGTEETIARFTAPELRDYLKGRLTTSNMLLVVVGNLTRTELESVVKSAFGTLPVGTYTGSIPPPVQHDQPSMKIVRKELPTNYIAGLFPVPAMGTTDGYAVRIAISVLGQRLFEEVRTKRGLSYAPAAYLGGNFSNYGLIYVTAVSPDTTIKVMLHEVQRLQDELISPKELRDKMNQFLTGYYLGVETNASRADLLARYELIGKGFEQADKFLERMRAITPDAIQKVCRASIHNLQYVLIGNPAALQIGAFMY